MSTQKSPSVTDNDNDSDSNEDQKKEIPDNKKCIKCDKVLPVQQFSKRFRVRGPWVQSHCKDCAATLKQERRTKRKDRPVPAALYVGMKYCRGHNREEPKSGFGMNKINTDFLDNYCKEWRSEHYKQQRIEKRKMKVAALRPPE
jgi:hypothetical protein